MKRGSFRKIWGGSTRKTRVKSVLSSILLAFSLILGNIAGFLPTTLYAHAEALPQWATDAGFNDTNATWDSSTSTLRLTDDVALTRNLLLSSDVTLDLNGKTITTNGLLCISVSANIIITGNGTIDAAGNSNNPRSLIILAANSGATLTLESGTIKNNQTSGAGGGVSVNNGTTFIMNGGTIEGCTAENQGQGGGVNICSGGTFIMTGGMIQNCTATQGGGVYAAGSFSMTGGEISGNSAGNGGTDVYVHSTLGVFYKTNTAVVGVDTTGPVTPAYAVNYNANGGSGSMLPQAVQQNTATALSANAFTRDGYTFSGWNTLADGTGQAYANGESVTFNSDQTLYAQWNDASGNNGNNNNSGNHGSGSSSGGSSHSETHVHSYTWVITSEPTAYENGEMVYQCSCGHIAARADIEASSKLVTDGIRSFSATAQGGTVKMDFGYYFSINKAFALAHDARADVTTIITYYYQGKHYEMTIPAGFNLLQTIDSKGWAGFKFIGSFPGIVTKEIP